jgi:RNA polymerase sigma-32 factor
MSNNDNHDVSLEEPPAGAPHTRGQPQSEVLEHYLREMRRYPVLKREEEHDLAERYTQSGDTNAAYRLVTGHLRLVVKIAREYCRSRNSLADLVQEGNVGLLYAVRRYDPNRGVRFSTYAAWWIRAYILKFILATSRMVKLGTTRTQRKLFFNLRRERHRLELLGSEVDHKRLADALGVSEAAVDSMDARLRAADLPIDGTSSARYAADASERPDAQIEAAEYQQLLADSVAAFGKQLEGRERQIFDERWLSEAPTTLTEMGARNGVTRERMRQIEARLKERFRSYLETELGSQAA